jgi:hypothetical protein
MRLLLTAAVLAAALCSPAARADEAAAKAVVEKAVKAAGWDKDPDRPNFTWKSAGKMTAGGLEIPFSGSWWVRTPDAYRFEVAIEFMGQKTKLTFVVDGDKVWESALDMTRDVGGEKKEYGKGQAYQFWVHSLTPLVRDKGFKLDTVPDKDVGGKPAAGVKVERDGKPAMTLYFDKATGLLAKSEVKVKDEFQGWKDVLDEIYFDDWKDAAGRKHFGKFRVVRDGKPLMEVTTSDNAMPAKLDPKLFEKP